MTQKPRNHSTNAKNKKDNNAPLVLNKPGRSSGTVRKRNRAKATEEIIVNMIGDWKDIDTSKVHGVSVKNPDDPSLTLAEMMMIDLKNPVIECDICGKFIFKDGLNSHLVNSHPKPKGKQKKIKRSKDRVSPPKPVFPKNNDPLENNELDGSKHVGILRKQSDGKFGSYPLHDDYSDESNAD